VKAAAEVHEQRRRGTLGKDLDRKSFKFKLRSFFLMARSKSNGCEKQATWQAKEDAIENGASFVY